MTLDRIVQGMPVKELDGHIVRLQKVLADATLRPVLRKVYQHILDTYTEAKRRAQ